MIGKRFWFRVNSHKCRHGECIDYYIDGLMFVKCSETEKIFVVSEKEIEN